MTLVAMSPASLTLAKDDQSEGQPEFHFDREAHGSSFPMMG
jgi:hypothetical protein